MLTKNCSLLAHPLSEWAARHMAQLGKFNRRLTLHAGWVHWVWDGGYQHLAGVQQSLCDFVQVGLPIG